MDKMPLMPYQIEFYENYVMDPNYRKYHINKARQIGFTEIMLRILQYMAFNKYTGYKIMIIAGTREKTTKKIILRFKNLFYNIPHTIKQSTDLYVELVNGTIIEGLPASSEAIRGDTKIKAVFVDEAAHFGLVDDTPVMDAIKPIVETNKSDLYLISTPRGRRGFFYEIDESENDFKKLKYDIFRAKGWIYTEEEANTMLKDPTVDAEQEYLNQYTTSRGSIFGSDFKEEDFDEEIFGV